MKWTILVMTFMSLHLMASNLTSSTRAIPCENLEEGSCPADDSEG